MSSHHAIAETEIQAVLARYAFAIDQDDAAAFADVFTDDAEIDFSRSLYPRVQSPAEFWEATRPTDRRERLSWQHVIRNPLVIVGGESARAFSELSATSLERDTMSNAIEQLEIGGFYADELQHTPTGWRIVRRTLHIKSRELWSPEIAAERLSWITAGTSARQGPWIRGGEVASPGPEDDEAGLEARLVDAVELRALLHRYAQGIDQRWWTVFTSAFTDDAVIDGSRIGLGVITPADLVRTLVEGSDGLRVAGQHLVSNTSVRIDGDTAHGLAEFVTHTVSRVADRPGFVRRNRQGGVYLDEYRRTAEGWRIARHEIRFKSHESAVIEYDPRLLDIIDASRIEIAAHEPAIAQTGARA